MGDLRALVLVLYFLIWRQIASFGRGIGYVGVKSSQRLKLVQYTILITDKTLTFVFWKTWPSPNIIYLTYVCLVQSFDGTTLMVENFDCIHARIWTYTLEPSVNSIFSSSSEIFSLLGVAAECLLVQQGIDHDNYVSQQHVIEEEEKATLRN